MGSSDATNSAPPQCKTLPAWGFWLVPLDLLDALRVLLSLFQMEMEFNTSA